MAQASQTEFAYHTRILFLRIRTYSNVFYFGINVCLYFAGNNISTIFLLSPYVT